MRRWAAVAMIAMFWPAGVWAGGGGHGGECAPGTENPGAARVVYVADNCFRPETITVRTGQTVQWQIKGSIPHTVTFAKGPDSGGLNGPFAVRFNSPGTYVYECRYHKGMQGTVVATGAERRGAAIEVLTESVAAAPVSSRSAGPNIAAGLGLLAAGAVLGAGSVVAVRRVRR